MPAFASDRSWRLAPVVDAKLAERARQIAERATLVAAKNPTVTRVLSPRADGLLADDDIGQRLMSAAFRLPAEERTNAVFVSVSRFADESTEIGASEDPALAMSWKRAGARRVLGEVHEGRLVFPDAFAGVDVLVAASPERSEELLLLRESRARARFSWHVELGSALSRLESDAAGGFVALSTEGVPLLRIPAAVVMDRTGAERACNLTWDGKTLTLDADLRGLSFPVLIDPAAESATWQAATVTGAPQAREQQAMAFDSAHAGGQLVVYGGRDAGAAATNTTQLLTGTVWSVPSPASDPGPLINPRLAFNGTNVVLFGGNDDVNGVVGVTWLWNGTNWSQDMGAGPSPRQGHAMSFAGAGKVMVFGGTAGGDETWVYTTDWAPACAGCVSDTSKPTARSFAAMAYAGGSNVLLFGGLTSALNDETWLWDGAQDRWFEQCTSCTAAQKPGARREHVMTWDSNRQRVILHGGRNGVGPFTDTWEWTGTIWIQTGTGGPNARFNTAMAYDSVNKRTVLFGGRWDSDGVVHNDTWFYRSHGSTCSTAADCNTGFCKDGKCCETACTADCRTCAGSNWGVCENVGSAAGVEDSDTCATTEMCNTGGVCKLKQGQTCSAVDGSECFAGFCTDGRCCAEACTAACKTCGNAQGTCQNLPQHAADAACPANNVCDGSGACKKANGQTQTCGGGGDTACASGYCRDGRCCEDACTTSCKSCNNAAGTCTTNVAVNTTDTNSTPTCSGTNACDGAGNCEKAIGQDCSAAAECASGFCADGKCCNTACTGECNQCSTGTCAIVAEGTTGNPSCSPLACDGTTANCPTMCGNNQECAPAFYCEGGQCLPDKQIGDSCTVAAECAGNVNCVDDVCCEEACTGACKACSTALKGAGANGVCGDIVDGGNPRAPGCTLGGTVCQADGKCNGVGNCRQFAPTTTPCGTGTTCDVNAVVGQLCDGQGECGTGGEREECAPAKCASGACTTTCATDADCDPVTGFCAGTVCGSKRDDGESCGGNNECTSGNCVSGVCCNNACAGACQTCESGTCQLRAADSAGSPSCTPFVCDGVRPECPDDCTNDEVCIATHYCKISDNTCQPRVNGTPCTADDQCPDEHCVDGVCCATACDGKCEHCDSSGTCVATTGEPVGDRGACPGHVDCRGTCDGETRDTCVSPKPQGTACGTPTCAANIETSSECDDQAECVPSPVDCNPFVCDATACKTTCTTDMDCQPGFNCLAGDCESPITSSVCSDDGTQAIGADDTITECVPYICQAGDCLRNCATTSECQSGYLCNTEQGDGVCEAPAEAPSADDGGCGCRMAEQRRDPSGVLLGLLAVGLVAARRRQRVFS